MKETVGDIDIIVAAHDNEKVVEHFASLPTVTRVISKGTTRSTVIMKNELQVDLRVVPPESYGSALQYLTGSKNHNIKLRTIAVKLGFKLNEYGLFERKTMLKMAGETEESIYDALGMTYVEPELREDTGEIESAMTGTLPELVEYKDLKGDLHVHSEWSDGSDSLEEISKAAIKRGLRYVAICDHSKALGIAGGLDEARLRKQMHEINMLNRTFDGFRLLSGIEVDIMSDGSLDLRDSVLKDLDFVVASIHRGFKGTAEKMTSRIVSAIHNEHVSAIGHPTGRILLRRQPYQLNLEEVLRSAKEQKVLMEINAFPNRLDLNDVNSRAAKKKGVILSIGTDAHTPAQLKYLEFGVAVARRGWLEANDVANTCELNELLTRLNR
jgi:DNA polymerase (family 10)